MICLYSLQSVKEDDNRDLVNESIADTYSYKANVSSQIWAMYRYSMINGCNLDRWVQRFADRVTNLHNRYSVLFDAYDELLTDGLLTTLESSDSETETRNLTGTNEETETNDSNTTINNVSTSEDLPATSGSSASSWLNARDITDATHTVDSDSTIKGTTTDKGTVTRERKSRNGMIPVELYDRMRKSLYDPYYEYAQEFYDLFIPYYATECCI